ncbi:MAG: hypothetical protein ACXWCG_09885 [Flavitalea sp.]
MKSIHSLPVRQRCLVIILSGVFFCLNLSCKKKDFFEAYRNNEIKATIVHRSGATVTIESKGLNAQFGCSLFTGSSSGEGTDDDHNRKFSFTLDNKCVTTPGTYTGPYLRYTPNFNSQSFYDNSVNPNQVSSTTQNTVTFIVVRDHYWEGSFTGECWLDKDTVAVSGTFKGERQ